MTINNIKKAPLRVPQRFIWTVQISIDKSIVADGFDLDNEGVHDMIARRLPYAYGNEFGGKVLTKPDKKLIRKAQGYDK